MIHQYCFINTQCFCHGSLRFRMCDSTRLKLAAAQSLGHYLFLDYVNHQFICHRLLIPTFYSCFDYSPWYNSFRTNSGTFMVPPPSNHKNRYTLTRTYSSDGHHRILCCLFRLACPSHCILHEWNKCTGHHDGFNVPNHGKRSVLYYEAHVANSPRRRSSRGSSSLLSLCG
jgi:hypothetical protein